ncbi:hypothetical protein LCGC14_0692000 [marine sediment metagenome]|uniref:Uncharacterized protein n=1 Tax=marine sediment metagenome TaxID=412755 RepID=A0A0F9HR05_9ZZZZ
MPQENNPELNDDEETIIAKLTYSAISCRLDRIRADIENGYSFEDAWQREFGEDLNSL